MDEKKQLYSLMQLEVSLFHKILASVLLMAVLIFVVYFTGVPNPNMILIAGLVLCSAMFGYGGGVVAAVIMLFYTLFFFSTDHSFISYTQQNLLKVIVTIIGIIADMVFVCQLKHAELGAFKEIRYLTKQLKDENEHLQQVSLTDALTGIHNRLALRNDYDSFYEHEVTVMMLDLDKFKQINDNYGHKVGDRILTEAAELLSEAFGIEHCYRYGGDEFLVIVPDMDEAAFREKLDEVMHNRPKLKECSKNCLVDFSVGIVHETVDEKDKLRHLFTIADERMYVDKRSKKACRSSLA